MPRCKAPPSTDWWQKSLIYDVYVKSFYDTNNDGVGDIEGKPSDFEEDDIGRIIS